MNANTHFTITDEMKNSTDFYANLRTEVLITTSDKIKLLLREILEAVKYRSVVLTLLGLFIALVTPLVAADFKDSLGLTKSAWHYVFSVASGVCGLTLAYATYRMIRLWKHDENHFVEQLKNKQLT